MSPGKALETAGVNVTMGAATVQGTGTTVTFAVPSDDTLLLVTMASTEYVAGGVLTGTNFDIVSDALVDGESTSES